MSRVGVLLVALACAVGPGLARAQEAVGGMVGLPLVVKENGWARYATFTEDGEPTEVVFKVGSAERHKGRPGRWLIFEMSVPELGRVGVELLVVGPDFSPKNLARVRMRLPGQPAQEADKKPNVVLGPQPKLRVLSQGVEQVAGQSIQVTNYELPGVGVASWSPSVPGIGLTELKGQPPLRLVAFGVGGDPWKGARVEPVWPDKQK